MKDTLKKLSWKHKNNRVLYYFKSYSRLLFPGKLFRSRLEKKLSEIRDFDFDYLSNRVNYYNKLTEKAELSASVEDLSNFRFRRNEKAYFFDSYEYTRYFNNSLKAAFEFGDVTYVPKEPAIVKTRPLKGENNNSVVLNLDKIRHFTFTKDRKDFSRKQSMLVGRNVGTQQHRLKFLEMYINHPMCNVGKVNNNGEYNNLLKGIMTLDEQLDYKFVLCLEGNDVATNLKWVMSSKSLAVMTIPKYESWFMEGTLIPDYHYVCIKDDYSDLEERLRYFMENEDKARGIIRNANNYIEQFRVKPREDIISLLVLEKYFYKTNQIDVSSDLKKMFG